MAAGAIAAPGSPLVMAGEVGVLTVIMIAVMEQTPPLLAG
jgi:hypothetical protein